MGQFKRLDEIFLVMDFIVLILFIIFYIYDLVPFPIIFVWVALIIIFKYLAQKGWTKSIALSKNILESYRKPVMETISEEEKE